MTARLSSLALAAAAVVLASACQGFESDTRCQFRLDPSELWAESDYDLIISEPPPFVCPIQLVQFDTRLNYSTTAVAPQYRRPVGTYNWTVSNALGDEVEDTRIATFGPLESDGTYKLQMRGQYQAGTAGYQNVMNDVFFVSGSVEKDFGIYPAWTSALFPYKCCPSGTPSVYWVAATSFARVNAGKATTLRAFRTNSAAGFTTIRWYRNNVEVNPPSNNPWAISGPRSAFTHTYTAPGTYTWKVVTTFDFPVKTNTKTWTQRVDP